MPKKQLSGRTLVIKKIMWDFGYGKVTACRLWNTFWIRYPHFAEQAEEDVKLLTYCYPYFAECLSALLTSDGIDAFLETLIPDEPPTDDGDSRPRLKCEQCGTLYFPSQKSKLTMYHLAGDRHILICDQCEVSVRTLGQEDIAALQQSFIGDLEADLPKNGQYLKVGNVWCLIERIERLDSR